MHLTIDGKRHKIGLFDAQRAMEQCELSVRLRGTSPTLELLQAVQQWAQSYLSVRLTLTGSWVLWWAVCEICDRTRKRSERIAEIGHWLHVDASRLPEDAQFGLASNVPRIKAQHKINSGQFDPTDYNTVYALVLLATGDENQARKAQADAAERYVDSKIGASK